jgi:hypothetical protein
MNFDGQGRVTDSLITADIVRRKSSFKIDAQKAQHFEQLCQLPAAKRSPLKGALYPR